MAKSTPNPLDVVEMTHPDLTGVYRKPRAYLTGHPDWSEVVAGTKPKRPARKAAVAAEKEQEQ